MKNDILKTEYSERFDDIRKKMMEASFHKYGPLKDNYGKYKCMDAIKCLELRLQKYKEAPITPQQMTDPAIFPVFRLTRSEILIHKPQVSGFLNASFDLPYFFCNSKVKMERRTI